MCLCRSPFIWCKEVLNEPRFAVVVEDYILFRGRVSSIGNWYTGAHFGPVLADLARLHGTRSVHNSQAYRVKASFTFTHRRNAWEWGATPVSYVRIVYRRSELLNISFRWFQGYISFKTPPHTCARALQGSKYSVMVYSSAHSLKPSRNRAFWSRTKMIFLQDKEWFRAKFSPSYHSVSFFSATNSSAKIC